MNATSVIPHGSTTFDPHGLPPLTQESAVPPDDPFTQAGFVRSDDDQSFVKVILTLAATWDNRIRYGMATGESVVALFLHEGDHPDTGASRTDMGYTSVLPWTSIAVVMPITAEEWAIETGQLDDDGKEI